MKAMFLYRYHAGLLAAGLFLAACQPFGLGIADKPDAPKALTVTPAATTVYLPPESEVTPVHPTTVTLEAKLQGAKETLKADMLQWTSSDPAIAAVDAQGKVLAVSMGSVVVMVRVSGDETLLATASVQVLDAGGRANVTVR
jgi:hypothetical protein